MPGMSIARGRQWSENQTETSFPLKPINNGKCEAITTLVVVVVAAAAAGYLYGADKNKSYYVPVSHVNKKVFSSCRNSSSSTSGWRSSGGRLSQSRDPVPQPWSFCHQVSCLFEGWCKCRCPPTAICDDRCGRWWVDGQQRRSMRVAPWDHEVLQYVSMSTSSWLCWSTEHFMISWLKVCSTA